MQAGAIRSGARQYLGLMGVVILVLLLSGGEIFMALKRSPVPRGASRVIGCAPNPNGEGPCLWEPAARNLKAWDGYRWYGAGNQLWFGTPAEATAIFSLRCDRLSVLIRSQLGWIGMLRLRSGPGQSELDARPVRNVPGVSASLTARNDPALAEFVKTGFLAADRQGAGADMQARTASERAAITDFGRTCLGP